MARLPGFLLKVVFADWTHRVEKGGNARSCLRRKLCAGTRAGHETRAISNDSHQKKKKKKKQRRNAARAQLIKTSACVLFD